MDYDNLDTCANCGEVLTENEKHENVDVCHKCFDKAFEDD
jgi:formylmethanofuran dehydrogenase subunit E